MAEKKGLRFELFSSVPTFSNKSKRDNDEMLFSLLLIDKHRTLLSLQAILLFLLQGEVRIAVQ